uniref:Origin recognition complex subunit 3 n=1 Tax=Oreochromis niloticus TaxID=8128 RepID=A0A669ERN2_ORENI
MGEIRDYFVQGCEDAESSEIRFRLCQELWDEIKTDTEVLQDELNRTILDSLLDFTRKCSSTRQNSDWTSQMRASEIPTAALMLGVNVPDHDMTFQSLSDMLKQSVSPHVASVQAKECGALKHLMKKVLERLMDTVVVVDDEDEEENVETSPRVHRSMHCSLGILCDWYTARTKKSPTGTPGKKRSSQVRDEQQQPPVVIIFKDLEAFNPRVLQDFILICSQYIDRLPLTFIFGIATSPSTIQHMLPHSVSSLLCIELFQSLSCTQHLATVIDKLILASRIHFKLNGKVMQVLIGVFLYHDFSVRNFIKGLQLALLEHFHSQPLSVLCCKKKQALFNVTQLSKPNLDRIRQLPSFKRYSNLFLSPIIHVFLNKTCLVSKRLSPFENLRNEALEFIDNLVKSHLSPPESQPLYEVCYYSSSATVRRHLNATPRTSIQAALSNPYYYLQNDSLKSEDGTVSNTAPDICIAYKLHLECGRLINLYDWLEAYSTVVSAAEGNDQDSENFGKVDEVKHARFIRAVSALEFLGFIKSTKQKTDHVARLTWGGC